MRFIHHVPLAAALVLLAGCESPPSGADADASDSTPVADVDQGGEAGEGQVDHNYRGQGQALRTIMQRLAVDMAALQHALWLEDFDQIEARTAAIAEHPHMAPEEVARIRQELGPEMSTFEAADQAVHQASVRMLGAARSRDTDAILEALAEVQRGCVACHEQFRERLSMTP